MIDDKEVIALAPRYPGIDLTSVAAFAFSLRCDRTEPLLDGSHTHKYILGCMATTHCMRVFRLACQAQ